MTVTFPDTMEHCTNICVTVGRTDLEEPIININVLLDGGQKEEEKTRRFRNMSCHFSAGIIAAPGIFPLGFWKRNWGKRNTKSLFI